MTKKLILLLFVSSLAIVPDRGYASTSFALNYDTPTCQKIMNSDPKRGETIQQHNYRWLRICDHRYETEPAWLGEEPKHPKHKTVACLRLERQYREVMSLRNMDTEFSCESNKSKYLVFCKRTATKSTPLAEISAQILEKAVNLNCFFY